MLNNFRKLKEYDHLGENNVSILSLETLHCIFWYDGNTYQYSGVYDGEYDFLLEYYVEGIKPIFRIENSKIVPYLFVTLSKENGSE